MDKKENRAMNILQKLYSYRLRIDKNGKTILNWSSLFSLACLILAPHMSIAGIILSLILGYHINLETDQDSGEFEERFRQAADTVKKTATAAAQTIRSEVEKAKTSRDAGSKTEQAGTARTEQAPAAEIPVRETIVNQQEVVEDLEKHANEFQANPAMYRSAFSAAAGSVPILEVHEEANENVERASRHMEA